MSTFGKALAMRCFGKLVEHVELDPDPNALRDITEEYNCVNCDSHSYCRELADTLVD